jgi:hypothetical protein
MFLESSIVWLRTIITWIPSILVSSWTFSWIIIFSIPSMAYRVLLIVPIYLPNWLLILPPKNRLNTCSVSIQVFWSNSIDLNRSSRFKTRVNSNFKLLQLRFMIYQLWLILGVIMVKIISLLCRTHKVTTNLEFFFFTSDIVFSTFNTFKFLGLSP